MSKVERFEDLKIWQLAREICQRIHKLTLKDPFTRDFKLVGQIKGSSGSIMDNIAEGFERDGKQGVYPIPYFLKRFVWRNPLTALSGIRLSVHHTG